MAEYKLTLKKRELVGKKTKQLRKDGLIPSVVYGNKEPMLLVSEYVPTEKVLQAAGHHSPIDLDIDGKKQMAIVKTVHIDPVSRQIINVEFRAVSANKLVEAAAPITLINFEESEAAKAGLAFTQAIEGVNVKAKPANLPKSLEIDISKLATIDDKITLADIVLPEGVEFVDKELNLEQTVASLYDPAAEAAAREAKEQAEAAESEAAESAEATEGAESAEEAPAENSEEKPEQAEA